MPDPSVASRSVADALELVRSHAVRPVERPLPLSFHVPAAPTAGRFSTHAAEGTGPLTAAVRDQRAGETSSVDLVEAALAAIDARDGELAAMVEVHAGDALAEATAADADRRAGQWRGPLHGVPVTVKDVIDVAGFTTRAGSLAYERLAVEDAPSVARLRAAGAIVLGKVSTHEFALGVTNPQSRNPHDPARIPGGSSGGSAISVATGMALGSLGTDTRASIRVPAALCGVVGMKATLGAVPTGGLVSLSWTMDHVAPTAATVADAALLLDVLMGGGRNLAGIGPAAQLRVGVPDAAFDVDPAVAAAVHETLEGLVDAGSATIVPLARPGEADLDLAGAAGLVVSRCEAATLHRSLDLDRFLYWDEVADQLAGAEPVTALDYLDAQRARSELADDLLRCFDTVDVLAMPTAGTVAPRVDDYERHLMSLARNAIPWSLVGFPAASVPAGTVGGLPVGIQLVAPPGREDVLVAAGLAVELMNGLGADRRSDGPGVAAR